jgi:ketosteroid isomerase-like protein
MKMKLIVLVMLFLSLRLLEAGSAKEEITAILEEQDAAWNRGDLDSFMKPYDDTAELVFIGANGPIRSSKVMKEGYEARYKTGQSDFGKLTFSQLEVEELAANLARAWGKWKVEQNEKILSGWFSLILRKKSDGWKIIHDHSSSD